ncbi:MAG TPA: PEP-CTERM sorting domain-containing protein [Candidatus Competibacteraceae bacterium]|nr:PEP-CTERM sorting domain-containing protein [Candidatus Competibacteraceae bacterium]HRZ07548.1 PEP-CTERM sorting domain-containing protein [Candidatus Competibacteraceae bacterium]HSA47105.1 PEP-CTERM sorting domain-containing protein [Candidatus Competibacteraceae bacterium]
MLFFKIINSKIMDKAIPKMKARHLLLSLWLLLLANPATAIIIDYDLKSLGGNSSYQYDYTVTNDESLGTGVALEWFAILFDPALYDEPSLSIITPDPPASEWDELILGSGLGVPAAYDVFALAGGIAVGASVSGFAVQFDWLGTGMPGAQPFEIYDPDTFDVTLATGSTRAAGTTVPEPGTLALLFWGAVVASTTWLRRRPR